MYWQSLEPREFVAFLKDQLTRLATGGTFDEAADYPNIRAWLLDHPMLGSATPTFIRRCRDVQDLWGQFKAVAGTYQDRRDYIRDQLEPLFQIAETRVSPVEPAAAEVLPKLSSVHVETTWTKAVSRCKTDPEGAITAARSLLESVFKAILESEQETYADDGDLQALYRGVRKLMRLSPEDHTDAALKKILGGAQAVAAGVAELRNDAGDAHGKGRFRLRPQPRHARFAINAAGTLAIFLIETWEARTEAARGGQAEREPETATDSGSR